MRMSAAVLWRRVLIFAAVSSAKVSAQFHNQCADGPATADGVNVTVEFFLDAAAERVIDRVSSTTMPINSPHTFYTGALFEASNSPPGCETAAYPTRTAAEGWIALVERGNCSFERKAHVALSLGAGGMLLFQKDPLFEGYTVMGSVPEGFLAASVSRDVGLKYLNLLQNHTSVYTTFTTAHRATAIKEYIPLILASILCPTAIILNSGALLAMLYYPEKPKPHLYIIINLIFTDLLVAAIGTALIFGGKEGKRQDFKILSSLSLPSTEKQ